MCSTAATGRTSTASFAGARRVWTRRLRFGDGDLSEPFRSGIEGGQTMPSFAPVTSPSAAMWMAFSATLPIGPHYENPEGALPSAVSFCDYASAANEWTRLNYCRTWFPVEC